MEFAEKSWRLFAVFWQIWAILQAQDAFFFNDYSVDCPASKIGLVRGWLFLEIICFYITFFAAFLLIFIAILTIRETGLEFREKKEHRSDFLTRYDTLNCVFQTYLIMRGTTIAAAVIQTKYVKKIDKVGKQ